MFEHEDHKKQRSHTFCEKGHMSYKDCDIQKIIEGVYIGDEFASKNKKLLYDLGIKHIIVAGAQLKQWYPDSFTYLDVPVKDHKKQKISEYFQATNQFIKKAVQRKQGVFVHCAKGKSRSATIILAYMMERYKMQHNQALVFMKRKRSEVSPNEGFLFQLKKYEQKLGISQ